MPAEQLEDFLLITSLALVRLRYECMRREGYKHVKWTFGGPPVLRGFKNRRRWIGKDKPTIWTYEPYGLDRAQMETLLYDLDPQYWSVRVDAGSTFHPGSCVLVSIEQTKPGYKPPVRWPGFPCVTAC